MQVGSPHKQCPKCGQVTHLDAAYCQKCGHVFSTSFPPAPPQQTQAFYAPVAPGALQQASSKKVAAGIFGLLLGSLGIHKFILGYTTAGLVMLLGSILTCGLVAPVFGLIGIIEGIVYLTKSDQEFHNRYIVNRNEWF